MVESVGEVRQVPVQRSLLCPDLNVPPPLDVEVLAVAAPEEESPGLDTVLAVRSRAEGALYTSTPRVSYNSLMGSDEFFCFSKFWWAGNTA